MQKTRPQQRKLLTLPQLVLIAIMVAAALVLPGSDVYTHTHEAWLYHYMLQDNVLLHEDFSMLAATSRFTA